MRNTLILLAALTLWTSPTLANCRHHHHHRRTLAHPCPPPCTPAPPPAAAPAPAPSLGSVLLEGFELDAGFRWDRCAGDDHDDRVASGRPVTATHDPFFIGAQFRVPVAERYGLFLRGERDWTEAPRGNVAVGLYFQPFYRERP